MDIWVKGHGIWISGVKGCNVRVHSFTLDRAVALASMTGIPNMNCGKSCNGGVQFTSALLVLDDPDDEEEDEADEDEDPEDEDRVMPVLAEYTTTVTCRTGSICKQKSRELIMR